MGARSKLNGASVRGALVVAGIAGLATASWSVFLIGTVGLILASVVAGDIRLGGGRK